jgi:hypothetical protein
MSAMPQDLRRHARYPFLAMAAQNRIWARLRQMQSNNPLLELASAPDYVVLPDGATPEYSMRAPQLRQTSPVGPFFAASFLMAPQENERPGIVSELDLSRRVMGALLADSRYDGDFASLPMQIRLWQWTPSSVRQLGATVSAAPAQSRTLLTSSNESIQAQRGLRPVEPLLRKHTSAMPLGDSLLGLESYWDLRMATRMPQAKEVVLHWQGQTARAATFAAALQELRSRALLEAMSQPRNGAPKASVTLRPAELLERARAQFEAMQRARQSNNWPAYGAAEKKLGELLKGLPQAGNGR